MQAYHLPRLDQCCLPAVDVRVRVACMRACVCVHVCVCIWRCAQACNLPWLNPRCGCVCQGRLHARVLVCVCVRMCVCACMRQQRFLQLLSKTAALPLDGVFDSGGLQGANSHVYVLSTGVRASHSDFSGRVGESMSVFGGYV